MGAVAVVAMGEGVVGVMEEEIVVEEVEAMEQ